jgi:hypothetical protein
MRVRFITSSDGDWVAMYVDGVKVAEGHSISRYDVLDALDIPYASEEIDVDPYAVDEAFPDEIDTETGKAK